ncbi:hypothetical protein GGS20DRAFT_565300 [Poronia punctata]|nr:hypothetical protein GGS20DRAFT_565300 [Poronia punctata]
MKIKEQAFPMISSNFIIIIIIQQTTTSSASSLPLLLNSPSTNKQTTLQVFKTTTTKPTNHKQITIKMQFSTVLALLLPVAAATAIPREASPEASADLAARSADSVCQSESMGYGEFCSQCLYRCQYTPTLGACYYATFISIKETQSYCESHDGSDCRNFAVNTICRKW